MLYSIFFAMKWLPKVTIFYVLFSFFMGLGTNPFVMLATIFFDIIDYIPMG